MLEKNVKVTKENLALHALQIDLQLENRRLFREVAEPKEKLDSRCPLIFKAEDELNLPRLVSWERELKHWELYSTVYIIE